MAINGIWLATRSTAAKHAANEALTNSRGRHLSNGDASAPLWRANQNAHTPSPDTWPVAHSRHLAAPLQRRRFAIHAVCFKIFLSSQGHVTGSPAGNWTRSIIQSMNVWRWSRDFRTEFVSTLKLMWMIQVDFLRSKRRERERPTRPSTPTGPPTRTKIFGHSKNAISQLNFN